MEKFFKISGGRVKTPPLTWHYAGSAGKTGPAWVPDRLIRSVLPGALRGPVSPCEAGAGLPAPGGEGAAMEGGGGSCRTFTRMHAHTRARARESA